MEALALQPPLHVGHGDDDGVDLLHADEFAQRLEVHASESSSASIAAISSALPCTFGPVNQLRAETSQ